MPSDMLKVLISLSLLMSFESWATTLALPMKATDVSGKPVQIQSGAKGAVLVFLSARCPCSNSHVELLKKLASENSDFKFYAIHSNGDESVAEGLKYFSAKSMPFPVIQDDHLKLADLLKANKTPHAFILNKTGEVIYRGGVTDSHEASKAHRQYLADSLKALREGHPLPESETRTLGCVISRASL